MVYTKNNKRVAYDRDVKYDSSRPEAFFRVSRTQKRSHVTVEVHSAAAKREKGTFDLRIESRHHVSTTYIYISKAWQGQTCGLCGYFDTGGKNNDLAIWNGQKLEFVNPSGLSRWGRINRDGWDRTNRFGENWLDREYVGTHTKRAQCKPPPLPHNPKCGKAAEKQCKKLYDRHCCARVDEVDFMDECAFDACALCEQDEKKVSKCVAKSSPLEPCKSACANGVDFDRAVLVPATNKDKLRRNKLIGRFGASDNFEISFTLKMSRGLAGWRSVLHVGDADRQRHPGVWLNGDRLSVMIGTTRTWDRYVCTNTRAKWPLIKANKETAIKIGAYSDGSKKVLVNGVEVCRHDAKNEPWRLFANKKVYAADPWYGQADAVLSDLVMTKWSDGRPAKTRTKSLACSKGEYALHKAIRCGSLTTFSNYELTFDIKPTKKVPGKSSILHVGRGRNYATPEMYFNSNGYQLVTRAVRGGSEQTVCSQPVLKQGQWSTVRVAFVTVKGTKYAKVYVNSELVCRVSNFDYMTVYDEPVFMANPWDKAAGALVRNVKSHTYKGDADCATILGLKPSLFYALLSAASLALVAALVYAFRTSRSQKQVTPLASADAAAVYGTVV